MLHYHQVLMFALTLVAMLTGAFMLYWRDHDPDLSDNAEDVITVAKTFASVAIVMGVLGLVAAGFRLTCMLESTNDMCFDYNAKGSLFHEKFRGERPVNAGFFLVVGTLSIALGSMALKFMEEKDKHITDHMGNHDGSPVSVVTILTVVLAVAAFCYTAYTVFMVNQGKRNIATFSSQPDVPVRDYF